jgi:hypothetical protein
MSRLELIQTRIWSKDPRVIIYKGYSGCDSYSFIKERLGLFGKIVSGFMDK